MIHELLGIEKNRVDLSMVKGMSEEMKEVVLSCHEDEFFKKVMHMDFGEVA
jgi:vacuolar protein sorting-associated protein 45